MPDTKNPSPLTHFDAQGQAHMVDVGAKDHTRRVAVALHHYGMPFTRDTRSIFGDAAAVGAISPLTRIPALVLDDGSVVTEITAICEYLDEKFPGDSLIGKTAEERAQTRRWTRWVDLNIVEPLANGFRYSEGLPMFQARMRCLPEAAAGLKAKAEGANAVIVSAAIESELVGMEPDDRLVFLEEMGLHETGLARVIRAGYELLHLITFFTVGPKEARAWTVHRGAKAPDAAGEIHSDMQRGFIRAETIAYDDYVTLNGEAGARDAGKLRLEGKEYAVKDGDVFHFRFNV